MGSTDSVWERYIQNFSWRTWWERSLQRPKYWSEDIIEMDLEGILFDSVDWILVEEDTNCYKCGNECLGSMKDEEFLHQLNGY